MPSFEYVALDAGGRRRKGVLNADTARLARRELRRRNLSPVSVASAEEKDARSDVGALFRSRSIRRGDLVLATRQLATLVAASAPVEESLRAVAGQTNRPEVRSTFLAVRGRVAEGRRLSDALGEHPKSFPQLYRAVVAAGETSGDLGAVLTRLADTLEKERKLQAKASTAAIYPAALACVAIAVIVALLTFVVPKLVDQFDAIGELPPMTRALLAISEVLQRWGLVLLGLVALGAAGFWRAMKIDRVKLRVDGAMLRIPFLGGLLRGLDGARFARTLATLTASGAPLLDGLRAATRTVSNARMAEDLKAAAAAVGEGTALSAALARSRALPPMTVYMIGAGERSGEIAAMLASSADHLESDYERVVEAALKLMEPAIIVVMGGVVLFIVLAVLTPVLSLNSMALG